ncbi:MAG: hypothetical protein HOI58_06235, partial [Kordiimonadaceae bacterium]|nr:hypothetical protein [Kordiimonadaceae bacterium]
MIIDQNVVILAGMGVIALLLCAVLYFINNRARMDSEERQIAADNAERHLLSVLQMNAGLEARIKTMSESHSLQQEEMKRTMHERLDAVSKRVGDSLVQSNEKTGESLEKLKERLA